MFFLLDFDGTLVDTEKFKKEALSSFFEKFEVTSFLREEGDSSFNIIRRELSKILSSEEVENQVTMFNSFQKDFLKQSIQQHDVCFEETLCFLKKLKEASIPSIIVTTSSRLLLEMVAHYSGIENYIDIEKSITKDDIPAGKEKPAPDPYLLAMTQHNISPENCYIVEDSIPGIKSGIMSGGNVFHINRTKKNIHAGTQSVSSLMDIFPFLDLS